MGKRTKAKRWHSESGQSVLETGLMIIIVFNLVFWTFEIGGLMYTYAVIADAANEGVRHAIVNSGGDVGGTKSTVTSYAQTSMHDVSSLTTTVSFPDGDATPPNRIVVSVSYPYVPMLGTFSPTMTAYAEGRMVVQ